MGLSCRPRQVERSSEKNGGGHRLARHADSRRLHLRAAVSIELGWSRLRVLSREVLGLFALALLLVAVLIAQQRRADDPVLPPHLFVNSSYVASILMSTLTATALFMCLFSIPLYVQWARGESIAESGLYIAPLMLAGVASRIAGSSYARRRGSVRGLLRLGSAASIFGLAALAFVSPDAPVAAVIAPLIVIGAGMGICLLGSIMNAQNAIPIADIGAGTGALLALRSIGGAIGSAMAGGLIASGFAHETLAQGSHANRASALAFGFEHIFAVTAAIAAAAFAVTLWMPNDDLRGSAPSSRQLA